MIKRYELQAGDGGLCSDEDKDGEWVKYEDIKPIIKQNKLLKAIECRIAERDAVIEAQSLCMKKAKQGHADNIRIIMDQAKKIQFLMGVDPAHITDPQNGEK